MGNTPYVGRDDEMRGAELIFTLSPKDRAAFENYKKEILDYPFADDQGRTWIKEVKPNKFKALLSLDKGEHVLLYETKLTGVVEFVEFRRASRSERGWEWAKGLLDGSPGK